MKALGSFKQETDMLRTGRVVRRALDAGGTPGDVGMPRLALV